MTPEEQKSLAEQITANPLWGELMDRLEANAVERMFTAGDEIGRLDAQSYARAARAIRSDCEAMLRSKRERKPAPA